MVPLLRLALVCSLLLAAACGSTDEPEADGRLTVAAAFFPIEEIARAVGGDAIDVITLVPPGEEAHEYEPSPQQVAELERADVVFYLGGGFQPSVEKTIQDLPGRVRTVDLLEGLTLLSIDGEIDPHVWLDPANMQAMADVVASTLSAEQSDSAPAFAAGVDAYSAALSALDSRFASGLAACASRVIITGHRAFVYLAAAYDLTQIPIAGISPLAEPSAKALAAVADAAREAGVTTIFFEENLPNDLARTIADEVGVDTAVLDNAESLSADQTDAGETYTTVMDANLAALRDGLGCT